MSGCPDDQTRVDILQPFDQLEQEMLNGQSESADLVHRRMLTMQSCRAFTQ